MTSGWAAAAAASRAKREPASLGMEGSTVSRGKVPVATSSGAGRRRTRPQGWCISPVRHVQRTGLVEGACAGEPAQHTSAHLLLQHRDVLRCQRCRLDKVDLLFTLG